MSGGERFSLLANPRNPVSRLHCWVLVETKRSSQGMPGHASCAAIRRAREANSDAFWRIVVATLLGCRFTSVSELPRQDPDASVTVDVTHSSFNYKDALILLGKPGVVRDNAVTSFLPRICSRTLLHCFVHPAVIIRRWGGWRSNPPVTSRCG